MTDDIDRIMAIMEVGFDPAWGEAWNRRQVSDSLLMPSTYYLLAGVTGNAPGPDDDAVGFALTRYAPGEEELLLIAVAPRHRRSGVGRTLLMRALAAARARGAERMFLEMRDNNPAVALYGDVGFEPIGRRKAYYLMPSGERRDAITFACAL